MTESQSVVESAGRTGLLMLGVDTCGPTGSVALARVEGGKAQILGQTELAGRSYSATLVSAVGELLTAHAKKLADLAAIVVVNGPGSFTGVRVGLSAVKGLAEPGKIPVVAVSRLAVLASKAGVGAAALDAHRNEVFLRLGGENPRELLAGAEELSKIVSGGTDLTSPVPKCEGPFHGLRAGSRAPVEIAVCDDAAAAMVSAALGDVELVRVEAPTAGDAIELCLPRIFEGDFADLA